MRRSNPGEYLLQGNGGSYRYYACCSGRRALSKEIAALETRPEAGKALLRLLVNDLRVSERSEILPTYRVVTGVVCALPSSVGAAGIEPATPRV